MAAGMAPHNHGLANAGIHSAQWSLPSQFGPPLDTQGMGANATPGATCPSIAPHHHGLANVGLHGAQWPRPSQLGPPLDTRGVGADATPGASSPRLTAGEPQTIHPPGRLPPQGRKDASHPSISPQMPYAPPVAHTMPPLPTQREAPPLPSNVYGSHLYASLYRQAPGPVADPPAPAAGPTVPPGPQGPLHGSGGGGSGSGGSGGGSGSPLVPGTEKPPACLGSGGNLAHCA